MPNSGSTSRATGSKTASTCGGNRAENRLDLRGNRIERRFDRRHGGG